jgi:hypothetical protein
VQCGTQLVDQGPTLQPFSIGVFDNPENDPFGVDLESNVLLLNTVRDVILTFRR